MNILITGGTGLIGKELVKNLRLRYHDVRTLTRKKTDSPNEYYWNIAEEFIDEKAFENLDSIIHLAGASVSERWSDSYKKELYSSRIDSAALLLKYCIRKKIRLKSFISASGINFYGTFTSGQILDENCEILHEDFLADLSQKWEEAAYRFSPISDRVVCLRTAVVLSNKGGAFPILQRIANLNLSSALGSGKQWMNWIHIGDMVNMYIFAAENPKITGNYNAVAEEIPTNAEFMRKLSKAANKIFLPIPVPAFIIKILFGEMSAITLEGTRASNKKIRAAGFDFKYRNIEKAFEDLL
ncbi:TIGR01777 family oxidoreductase [Kaistella palustris]|uniref:TIGR01777 family oxidoreductase n=1 Tax=Kaistella palustris TaxID=493376 RepID=UPI000422DB7C|nr:TIGR01777 family oxidoreductase [Kaistella palustris]